MFDVMFSNHLHIYYTLNLFVISIKRNFFYMQSRIRTSDYVYKKNFNIINNFST